MRYKFEKLNLAQELKIIIDKPVNVIDSGDEMVIDFFDYTLKPNEEQALKTLMGAKTLLRGKQARFAEKGLDIEIEK